MASQNAPILVASDSAANADLIARALAAEFAAVHASPDPDRSVAEFDRVQPGVLVLAYVGIERAEQLYLELFRQSTTIAKTRHRTILLCHKDDVRGAYDLCRRDCFDDYVLYWPATFDQPRLAMSVRLALHALAVRDDPSAGTLAEVAQQLAAVGPLLDDALTGSHARLDAAGHCLRELGRDLGRGVQDFSSGLTGRLLEMNAGGQVLGEVARRLKSLHDDHIRPHLEATATAIAPARDHLTHVAAECRPRIDALVSLAENLARAMPAILIVEDEETQRQVFKHLLERSGYRVMFAATGAEAIRLAAHETPGLVLMDVMLPDANGIDLTRQLRSIPQLAQTPVVVITGRSERRMVVQSLEAGAADFLVKPFTARALQSKVERHLGPPRGPSPRP